MVMSKLVTQSHELLVNGLKKKFSRLFIIHSIFSMFFVIIRKYSIQYPKKSDISTNKCFLPSKMRISSHNQPCKIQKFQSHKSFVISILEQIQRLFCCWRKIYKFTHGVRQPPQRRPKRAPAHKVQAYLGNLEIISRSEEHTSELQSHSDLVCRLLLEKKKKKKKNTRTDKA